MDRKKQKSIDSHFQRTVKMKTGEILQVMPSKVKEDVHFSCQYSNCGTKCANKGALATHMKFAHRNGNAGSISIFFVQKPKHTAQAPSIPGTMASHVVSAVSNLTVVQRLFPVFREVEAPPKIDGRISNRGADDRHAHSAIFKANIIDEFLAIKEQDSGFSQDEFALDKGISQSLLSKWLKRKDVIFKRAADNKKKNLCKTRKSGPLFPEIESNLLERFKTQRKEGRRVSSRWFKKQAKKIANANKLDSFKASKGWFFRFLTRNQLALRKKTNSKKASAAEKLPKIRFFHQRLRLFLATKMAHPKWGRFLPKNRYNVDQVPLPFSCVPSKTYEEKGAKRVHIKMNQPAMEKRFCSLQLLIRVAGKGVKQPDPTCIFRGLGKRISQLEKASWDPRVNVMFQKKAWADREFTNAWLDQVLLKEIRQVAGSGEESLVFCDNLDAQIQPEFVDRLSTVNGFRYLFPTDCTEQVQPIDGGVGYQLKVETGHEFEDWLEDDENLDLWENGKLSESDKRILITKFVGAAWEKLCSNKNFNPDVYFQKTGCLLTVDGSEDDLVNVEGLPYYKPAFVVMNDDEDLPAVADEQVEAAEEPPSDVSSEDDSDIEVEEALSDVAANNFEFFNM